MFPFDPPENIMFSGGSKGNIGKQRVNDLFKYFKVNNLLSSRQSGFITGDLCVQQLIVITHEIYKAFDCSPPLEVQSVFLVWYDKVWHDGLLHKLKQNGINGDLLKLIESFLLDRYQRVALNGQTSKWGKITAGLPQGFILGLLFFLIYIKDLLFCFQGES